MDGWKEGYKINGWLDGYTLIYEIIYDDADIKIDGWLEEKNKIKKIDGWMDGQKKTHEQIDGQKNR